MKKYLSLCHNILTINNLKCLRLKISVDLLLLIRSGCSNPWPAWYNLPWGGIVLPRGELWNEWPWYSHAPSCQVGPRNGPDGGQYEDGSPGAIRLWGRWSVDKHVPCGHQWLYRGQKHTLPASSRYSWVPCFTPRAIPLHPLLCDRLLVLPDLHPAIFHSFMFPVLQ